MHAFLHPGALSAGLSATPQHNLLQAGALMLSLLVLVAVPATLLWGAVGIIVALLAAAAVAALSVWISADAIMRLYQATLIPRDDSQLSSLVDVLAYRAELPSRPDLYVVPSTTLTAFAVGSRERPAIAVSEGLLRRLSLAETAGVLAHEIAHIRNNDLPVLRLADVITRVLQLLSYVGLAFAAFNIAAFVTGWMPISWWAILPLYLGPALSSLLQISLPRDREYQADRAAAALTGDPAALASAIRRLEPHTGHFWEDLMLPVPARRVPQPSLLRSHPEAEERIRNLSAESSEPASDELPVRHTPLVIAEQPMISLVGYGPGDMRPRYRWPGLWF